ncbi:hypothetical protein BCR43DRAFT_507662 [Syncephalastrum racemosum]|uniref:Disease resistance R13L4/SHOC-2-like LRR domain-containing protein n=1 Tax=Syncephalastrum racemosum TaxID=13706 RepID=A0A1X2H4F1_SYNRA|nr:hypothetical protein BCR43DRAFT_507662 [Syncephalastrum racemosum]
MHELVLYCQSLTWLHPNLSLLSQLQKLDLSGNYLTQLPDAIGSLQRLEVLHLQHNQLRSLPDTLGYLTHLKELDVSYNKLQSVTPYIGHLRHLETFQLLGNALLTQLPTTLGNLARLVTLSVANCPALESLPAEILGLNALRHLRVAESHALQAPIEAMNLAHTPPSLVELCARRLYPEVIPAPAFRSRHHAQPCSACGKPYFESFVSRSRLVEKAEVIVRVEYRLCSAHWNTEDDRLLYTFSAAPPPTHIKYPPLPLPPLPTPSKQKKLSLHHIKNSRPYRFKRPAAAKAP